MNLGRLSISQKILISLGILIIAMIALSTLAITGSRTQSGNLDRIGHYGFLVQNGARLGQTSVELNRAEFRLSSDPASFTLVQEAVETLRPLFLERLAIAQETTPDDLMPMVDGIANTWRDYEPALAGVLVAGEIASEFSDAGSRERIVTIVEENRTRAVAVREAVTVYVDALQARSAAVRSSGEDSAELQQALLIWISVGSILVSVTVAVLIARRGITLPLASSIDTLKALANDDLAVTVSGTDRRDEIGDIARGLEVFRENALQRKALEEEERNEAARRLARAETIAKLTTDFENQVAEILEATTSQAVELEATAQTLSSASEQTLSQASIVASSAEETSASVQTVAAATNELLATIADISQRMDDTRRVADAANGEAENIQTHMNALTDAGRQITDVIGLIADIAEQTNLLALNATIEAARAGDAGKGFAVVAQEVKSLANQAASATDDIRRRIKVMEGSIGTAAAGVSAIGETIRHMNTLAVDVATSVEQQNAAVSEIGQNAEQAARGTEDVSASVQDVRLAAETAAAGSTQILSSAGELAAQSQRLKSNVGDYIDGVRAA